VILVLCVLGGVGALFILRILGNAV
jgi:hypothetical protein